MRGRWHCVECRQWFSKTIKWATEYHVYCSYGLRGTPPFTKTNQPLLGKERLCVKCAKENRNVDY